MTNASTTPGTTDSTSRNKTLEDAWQRFAKYDKNAIIAQRRFIQQRKWILGLGVAATTLAVLYSTVEGFLKTNQSTVFPAWLSQQQFLDVFHSLVIIIPISVTILVAFSVKFNMGISWVMLRSSAEALRKEIYRYRMQIDEYNPAKVTQAETRDVRLARKLKLVSKRLMETPVNQTDLLPYQGDLPPLYATPKEDDGFSNLTPEQYVVLRVEDQFNYYQKKAARLGRELRNFQALIIVLGGVGALLAAIKFDVWIAVSNALSAALASYLEFKRVETNVVSCNLAAADLYDIRIWWHALLPDAKQQQTNIETLVSSTEAVIQTENAGWLQEMRDALAEIYGDKTEAEKNAEDHRTGQTLIDQLGGDTGSAVTIPEAKPSNESIFDSAVKTPTKPDNTSPVAENSLSQPAVEQSSVADGASSAISSEEDFSGRLAEPQLIADVPAET